MYAGGGLPSQEEKRSTLHRRVKQRRVQRRHVLQADSVAGQGVRDPFLSSQAHRREEASHHDVRESVRRLKDGNGQEETAVKSCGTCKTRVATHRGISHGTECSNNVRNHKQQLNSCAIGATGKRLRYRQHGHTQNTTGSRFWLPTKTASTTNAAGPYLPRGRRDMRTSAGARFISTVPKRAGS